MLKWYKLQFFIAAIYHKHNLKVKYPATKVWQEILISINSIQYVYKDDTS